MRLADFILQNMEDILKQWECFARSIQPIDGDMDTTELRDHAEAMLKVIATDLGKPQTEHEGVQKSQGRDPQAALPTDAELHADERRHAGFSIELLVSEYRALRASVLRLWMKNNFEHTELEVNDIIRFNEAIDQALAESVKNYSKLVLDSQDIFLGILGHDLRSPLQSVSLGAAYLMRTPSIDGRLIQLGARMYNSAVRMGEMLDDLLDYTKVRIGGGLGIALQPIDLAPLCAQVVDEFLASHPSRVVTNISAANCSGKWDGKRLGQVFQNLIGNALQYSAPDSTIEVALQGNADAIIFCVHNEGVPIPESEQKSLFDPLRRHVSNKPEDSYSSKNLGLGLYIARELVVAHHGTISVTSTAADGTTFKVTLPKSVPESH